MLTANDFNTRGVDHLPGHLGIVIAEVSRSQIRAELSVKKLHMAPNGYLHAATVIALADTACGYACMAHLPAGAENFTTIELKCNFLGTARDGTLESVATPVHLGRTTQVWDAIVRAKETRRDIAVFRCTQLVIWPRSA